MCIRDRYKDNQAISNATKASYTIDSAKKSDEGSYKVVVTNTKNDATATATSNVCTVTVQVPDEPKAPTITTNLGSVKTAQTGDSVSFMVKAVSNNSGTLSYQWYKNGQAITNAVNDSYTIASASLSDGGIYLSLIHISSLMRNSALASPIRNGSRKCSPASIC